MPVADPIPPSNVKSLDSLSNITPTPVGTTINNSPGANLTNQLNQQFQGGPNSSIFVQQLNAGGINFSPVQNPLNLYANYTYHIRLSLTNESNAYNVDGTFATTNGIPKLIIAESGVTAGFNITEFEFKNNCSPGDKHMNTTATTWTMTITEPFGLTLIDKILSSNIVTNWARAPFFIEVWFTGYNVDGTVMNPNLFYTIYRVILLDMNVKVTEAGSVYSIEGVFDGDVGHSNEISLSPAKFTITARTVEDFFTQFQNKLNTQTADVNNQKSDPITIYAFNIPIDIAKWPLKISQSDQTSQRSADMIVSPQGGVTTISGGKGDSIESIVNRVLSTSPNSTNWVTGVTTSQSSAQSTLATNGLAQWFILHSAVQITGVDTGNTNDYKRVVTYSIVPYSTIVGPTDQATVNLLQQPDIQRAKLNFLINQNALIKEYDYIYTGLNTEIIGFDINIDHAWTVVMAQWSALNSYYNYTQGPLYANSAGDQSALGKFTTSSGASGQNGFGSSGSGTTYAEDVVSISSNSPYTIVVRQNNKPSAPNTDQGTDTNKAMPISEQGAIPPSRAFTGSFLDNLYGNAESFLKLEIDIRGDPYWMGYGNIVDNDTALAFGQVSAPSSGDTRYNYLKSSVMFVLSFSSGTNYDSQTGLMNLYSSDNFYNGVYSVTEVTNTFKNGSFTQHLSAYKDPFTQNATLLTNTQVGKSI